METLEAAIREAAREAAREILENHISKRWLTTQEAADHLGVTVAHLERLRYRRSPDSPPWSKLGRLIRYDRLKLDQHLVERNVPTTKNAPLATGAKSGRN